MFGISCWFPIALGAAYSLFALYDHLLALFCYGGSFFMVMWGCDNNIQSSAARVPGTQRAVSQLWGFVHAVPLHRAASSLWSSFSSLSPACSNPSSMSHTEGGIPDPSGGVRPYPLGSCALDSLGRQSSYSVPLCPSHLAARSSVTPESDTQWVFN